MDKGAWRATIQAVAKSPTRLKRLSTHTAPSDLQPGPVPLCIQGPCVASEGCLRDSQGPPCL